MGEMFSVWDAAIGRISDRCGPFVTRDCRSGHRLDLCSSRWVDPGQQHMAAPRSLSPQQERKHRS